MVVEIDRQGDIFLQERFPEISDMPFKKLVDIEVVIELLLRAVATVCRKQWNIQGEASNNEQVKIKRKSFEMSCISVFCKMWKMQTTTEY